MNVLQSALNRDAVLALDDQGAHRTAALVAEAAAIQRHFIDQGIKSCGFFSKHSQRLLTLTIAAWATGIELVLPASASTDMHSAMSVDVYWDDDSVPNWSTSATPVLDCGACDRARLTVFTSGSSGQPKAISKTMNQLCAEVDLLAAQWPKTGLFVATVSHQHMYGFIFKLLWPLLKRQVIWLPTVLDEEVMSRLSAAHGPLVMVSSPAFLKRLQNPGDLPAGQLLVFSSGGLLPESDHHKAQELLKNPVVQVYGSSETGAIAHRALDQRWQLLPTVSAKQDAGLLWVQSPHCHLPGWQNTQDRVQFHADGFVLLGRADRIVKLEEKRVSLDQVEQLLTAHEWLTDAAVVVLEGPRQHLGAVAQLNALGQAALGSEGEKAIKQQLKAALKNHIEPMAVPRRWRLTTDPLLNAQGKKVQSHIKAMFV